MSDSNAKFSLFIGCVFVQLVTVAPSLGDHSLIYQRCLHRCMKKSCSAKAEAKFYMNQAVHMRMLQWTCTDECAHHCMWRAVAAFHKDNTPIPQFHGKWPFIRVFGIQEPASAYFSILNAAAHCIMLVKFHSTVPAETPMYYVWHGYALVAINAWIWSSVFHSRDVYFTELMDYFCAFSLVLYQLFVLCARLLVNGPLWQITAVATGLLSFFVYHIHYLAYVDFDYGYNMRANISVGVVNALGWLIWCYLVSRQRPYVWKAVATVLAVSLFMSLEVCDFVPIWWVFDAHALWHVGTAPLPFLWYSFMIDDSLHFYKDMSADTEKTRNNTTSSTTTTDRHIEDLAMQKTKS